MSVKTLKNSVLLVLIVFILIFTGVALVFFVNPSAFAEIIVKTRDTGVDCDQPGGAGPCFEQERCDEYDTCLEECLSGWYGI